MPIGGAEHRGGGDNDELVLRQGQDAELAACSAIIVRAKVRALTRSSTAPPASRPMVLEAAIAASARAAVSAPARVLASRKMCMMAPTCVPRRKKNAVETT